MQPDEEEDWLDESKRRMHSMQPKESLLAMASCLDRLICVSDPRLADLPRLSGGFSDKDALLPDTQR